MNGIEAECGHRNGQLLGCPPVEFLGGDGHEFCFDTRNPGLIEYCSTHNKLVLATEEHEIESSECTAIDFLSKSRKIY
jgi:hypothetical protein